MSWVITFGGETYSTLDLTLDEVEALERISGEPWSLLNPIAKIGCAKAFLAVFMLRRGDDDEAIAKQLGALTLGEIVGAFEYVDDAASAPSGDGEGKGPDPTSAAVSLPPSSGGEPSVTAGPLMPSDGNG